MLGYNFHANALGLGGVLRSGGVKTSLPSLASVVLAPTGGNGSAVVENYNANGISFTRAESRVFGSEVSDTIYTTHSDVYITNLTIFDRLRIALMSATLSSTRDVNLPDSSFEINLVYRGISIDGAEIIPILDGTLSGSPTFRDVQAALNSNVNEYASRFGMTPTALLDVIENPSPREPISGALVRDFTVPNGVALTHSGHAVDVPGVGRAHFGEFLFKPGQRQVSLLRIKIGSGPATGDTDGRNFSVLSSGGGDDGDLTGGYLEGNGSPPTGGG